MVKFGAPVEGQKKYYKLAECKKGQILVEGKYVGVTEAGPTSMYPGSLTYNFKPLDGSATVGLSGGQLGYLLEENAREGDIVQVTYQGMEKIDKGRFAGKDSHQFTIALPEVEGEAVPQETASETSEESTGAVDLSGLD